MQTKLFPSLCTVGKQQEEFPSGELVALVVSCEFQFKFSHSVEGFRLKLSEFLFHSNWIITRIDNSKVMTVALDLKKLSFFPTS